MNGGADQGQVREGLGEVAKGLTARPDLLRVETQVVGVGEHLLQNKAGLPQPTSLREAFDEPERA